MTWAKHVAQMGEMRNAYKIVVGKPEGKGPLRIYRHEWEDNIRMDLEEIGREDVDWVHLTQDRGQWWALVNKIMNIPVP
jgi:hypothetical protein